MRLTSIAILMALCGPALADDNTEVYVRQAGANLDVTVIGGPQLTAGDYSLRTAGIAPVIATSLRTYAQGDEPITIALVYSGQEPWIGNDDFEPEDSAARYLGALKSLETAIDGAGLATVTPSGSMFFAVAYSDHPAVRVPLEPMAQLHGAQLGTQKDYRNAIGSDVAQGVQLALDELDKAKTPRRALIVVGDGNDTNRESARAVFTDLKKRAAQANVKTLAIVVKSALSDTDNDVAYLTPHLVALASAAELPAELASAVHGLADRVYLTFPGVTFPRDGRSHDLVLGRAREDLEPVSMVLGTPVASPAFWTWWKQLLAGMLLVGLAIGISRWRAA